MSRPNITLDQIFETQIQTLALTQRPHTVDNYRYVARRFLAYLHTTFPQVRRLVQLRRDPHLLGWFRWLCEQDPPLRNGTRINHLLRHYVMAPAQTTYSASAVCSKIWLPTAIPSPWI